MVTTMRFRSLANSIIKKHQLTVMRSYTDKPRDRYGVQINTNKRIVAFMFEKESEAVTLYNELIKIGQYCVLSTHRNKYRQATDPVYVRCYQTML